MTPDRWSLAGIDHLGAWLFDGLVTAHTAPSFGERKYALDPVVLDDRDYNYLQIVRQVRTFDRASLPRLRQANEQAIDMWRPTYGLGPLIDMLGLVQELGSNALHRQIVELTLPRTLNRLGETERVRLLSALVDVLITHNDFRLDGPLYASFQRITDLPGLLAPAMLADALALLVGRDRDGTRWREILANHRATFLAAAGMEAEGIGGVLLLPHHDMIARSPLGRVFFEIERSHPIDYFEDLLTSGGRHRLEIEETWVLDWLLEAQEPSQPGATPVSVTRSGRNGFWLKLASKRDAMCELAEETMPVAVLRAFTGHLKRRAVLSGSVTQMPAAEQAGSAEESDAQQLRRKLGTRGS